MSPLEIGPASATASESEAALLWPQAPTIKESLRVSIEPPELRALEDEEDSFKMVQPEEAFPGQIVYSASSSPRLFVFRSIGRSRRLGTSESRVASYVVRGMNEVFAPAWYPGSRDVYFRTGDAYIPGTGVMTYRWNLAAQKVETTGFGPMQLREINWSPSGKFATYLQSRQVGPGDIESELVLRAEKGNAPEVQPPSGNPEVSWLGDTLVFTGSPPPPPVPRSKRRSSRPVKRKPQPKLSEATQKALRDKQERANRPCLYTLTPGVAVAKRGDDSKAQLLVRDAYRPSASPNGRWITYTGWLSTDADGKVVPFGTRGAKERFGLCLLERPTGKRFWLRPEIKNSLSWLQLIPVCWFPDSKKLLVVENHRFYVWSLDQLLAGSLFPDAVPEEMEPFAKLETAYPARLEPNGFANSGRHYFFKCSELKDSQNQLFHRSLRALDLRSGEIKTVFEWTKDQGVHEDFDWRDESIAPAPAPEPAP